MVARVGKEKEERKRKSGLEDEKRDGGGGRQMDSLFAQSAAQSAAVIFMGPKDIFSHEAMVCVLPLLGFSFLCFKILFSFFPV